jgi:hypothetical protein
LDNGWIKLWRRVILNPIFKDDALIKCWVYCLLRANHETKDFLVNHQMVSCEPGEFVTGRYSANLELGWKSKKFERKVESLRRMGFLTKQTTNQYTKIKIINWSIYQGSNNNDDQLSDQQMTKGRPTDDQGVTTNKNVKNVKNEKKISISPDEFLLKLKTNPAFSHIDIDNELHKMDAWLSIPKNKNRKKTPRFVLNWLNKIERPIKNTEDGYSHLEVIHGNKD